MIGTGKQALAQVAAVVAVRPIKRIRVFGRDEERRKQFASRVKQEFEIETLAAGSISKAVSGASVITLATRATEPIISAEMITRRAHINAIGAIVPSRAEIAPDVLDRCDQIVVDSVPAAQKLSRELVQCFGPAHQEGWKCVRSLADLVGASESRQEQDDLTLFKSLGTGISDLALGIELYRKARAEGLGREFTQPQKAAPRLRVANAGAAN
jgi:ornithine cyclodeaminase